MNEFVDAVPAGKAFFPKTLYSNEELLKTRGWSAGSLFLLFIVNVSLIAAPFFMARAKTDPSAAYAYMPGVETALTELYDAGLACGIASGTFSCTADYAPFAAGDYAVYVLPADASEIAGGSRIVFGETAMAFYYEAPDDRDDYVLSGSYALLDGMYWGNLDKESWGFGNFTEAEFDAYLNETVVGAILYADLGRDFVLIYLGQLVQTILYVFIMSFLFLAANLRRATKKIRYRTSLAYVVAGITGPALLAAVAGLFATVLGTILWSGVYALRMILLYSKINNRAGTF